eukprot:gene337-378_t
MEGTYEHGEMHGLVRITSPDGSVSEGICANNKWHGRFKVTNATGDTNEGTYEQ